MIGRMGFSHTKQITHRRCYQQRHFISIITVIVIIVVLIVMTTIEGNNADGICDVVEMYTMMFLLMVRLLVSDALWIMM